MRATITVMKKEFARIFKDKRLVKTLLLPGILLYVIYSLLGGFIGNMTSTDSKQYVVALVDAPTEIIADFEAVENVTIERIALSDIESEKARLNDGSLHAIVDFSSYSETLVAQKQANVNVFFNSSDTESTGAYSLITALLTPRQNITADFSLSPCDVATQEDVSAMLLSTIAPMLLVTFLFSGCASLVPESIAGEKERGSFATMLVTPVKRSSLAGGKILALSAAALLSGCCSALGLILSLPSFVSGMGEGFSVSLSAYRFGDYFSLFLLVVSTTAILVSITAILSTLSKSVKEATGYVSPLMMLPVLLGILYMFFSSSFGAWACFIPVLNAIKLIGDVFSFSLTAWQVAAAVATNALTAIVLTIVLAKLFDSEKIICGS